MQEDSKNLKIHWQLIVQQNRSERTHEALLDAVETLILEKGTKATAITEIAERAGFSTGAVYHHFRDKKAIFFALFQRSIDCIETLYKDFIDTNRLDDLNTRELIRTYLDVSIMIKKDIMVSRATAMAVTANYPEFAERFTTTMIDGRKIVYNKMLIRRSEIGSDDPEFDVGVILDQLSAMFASHIDHSRRASALSPLDDIAFVETGTQIAAAYLKLEPVAFL